MNISIFIARILGPASFIVALGLLLNRDFYLKVFDDFINNTAFLYMGGLMALILGLVMIINHNIWEPSWVVIITIYGWLALTKGVLLTVFPKSVKAFTRLYHNNPKVLRLQAYLMLLFGIFIMMKGL